MTDDPDFAAWLATRPRCVQRLAAEFPAGMQIDVRGALYHVIGWTEDDALIVSRTDPKIDFEMANATREYLCASHLRSMPPAA